MTLQQITKLTFDQRSEALEQLTHKSKVRFAIYCAELVTHLDKTVEGPKALATAKAWLEGEATTKECDNAARAAAYPSTSAASSASYAASASYAYAYATSSASAAASASAYYAASAAASSAASYKSKMVKYLQILWFRENCKDVSNLTLQLLGVTE